jgi:hypothetical protein
VSPASAALTAFWMLRKSQRPFLQTVWVSYGRGGLGSTLPGSLGSGYVWALAPAGASSATASAPAVAILSEVRMVPSSVSYGSTTYQPVIPVS